MDYVVFGIGFGATILVLGLLIRDLGPRMRYRTPSDPDGVFHAEELVAKVAWDRFSRSLGAVLAIGGAAFVIATGICIVLMLSDSTGGWVMLGSLVTFFILMLFWTWAFFDRFGSYGILPEREEAPVEAPVVERPRVSPPATERATVGPPVPVQEAADDPEVVVAEDTPTEPVQTPEERLAGMEAPIEHGSAEDALDMATGGRARPPRGRHDQRRAEGNGAPVEQRREEASPEAEQAPDRNEGQRPDTKPT